MDNTLGPMGTIDSGQGANNLMSQQQMQAIIQSLQQKTNPNNATQTAIGTQQPIMASPVGAAANMLAGGLGPLIHALLKQSGADDAGGPDEDPNAVAGGPDSPTDTSAGS